MREMEYEKAAAARRNASSPPEACGAWAGRVSHGDVRFDQRREWGFNPFLEGVSLSLCLSLSLEHIPKSPQHETGSKSARADFWYNSG